MTSKDTIFKKKGKTGPFQFNSDVARAFDDMARRSIPCYEDLQFLIARLSLKHYRRDTFIYDLGCSTGNTALEIFKQGASPDSAGALPLIRAVDKSEDMIARAKKKCGKYTVQWMCAGIEDIAVEHASVVIAAYVFQFLDPDKREPVLKNIYTGLCEGGLLIMSEKIRYADPAMDMKIVELYHDFKKHNKYSRLEIEQKDTALKNVLVPLTVDENMDLLRGAGFKNITIIFKYLNFVCLTAEK